MLKDYDNMDLISQEHLFLLRVYHLPNLGTHSYAVNAVATDGGKFGTMLLQRKQEDIHYDGNGI